MKTLLTLIILLFFISAKAQKIDSVRNAQTDTTVFASVERAPSFPGGIKNFLNYLAKNLRYPVDARTAGKQGKVIVQMIVEKDGSISHVTVIRKTFPSLDAEAVRVVSSSPKWLPGMQNGFPLRVRYTVPISFSLGG